jgi:hypothetical protein
MKCYKDEAPDAILNIYPILNTSARDSMAKFPTTMIHSVPFAETLENQLSLSSAQLGNTTEPNADHVRQIIFSRIPR